MTGRIRDFTVNRDGSQNVTVTVDADFTQTYEALKDKPVNVEIKKAGKTRSKDANAFCWALCAEIGKAMNPPLSKEEVYRKAIRAVGVYTEVILYMWDVKTVLRRWGDHGTGWFAEIIDDAGTGKKRVHLYYGTSTYTVQEMQILLNWLTDQAQQMEIAIPLSKKEEAEMLERWGQK